MAAYAYDPLDRLAQDQITSNPSSARFFTYDPNGNRAADSGGNYSYSSASNRLTQTPLAAIALDASGNTLSDGVYTYAYNQDGHLSQVLSGGNVIATYTYNHQRQRTRKVTAQGTIVYHYDQAGHLIAETTSSGAPIKDYVWTAAQPIAQISSGAPESLLYLHADHLGTPRLASDATQTVVWRYEGNAFGDSAPTGSATVNLRFAGQYADQESGLFYDWNRYYDPRRGRYISSDPIELLGGLNTYNYVRANPLRWTDPQGLWSPGAHDQIFQNTFENRLSRADIARLQQASRNFDKSTQAGNLSFLHSMMESGANPVDAMRLRDEFISVALADARRLAKTGDRNAALDRLGQACHPIMDSSSPMHTNPDGTPRVWNPNWPFGHSPNDTIGNETVHELTPQILRAQSRLLNDAYDKVFGP